MLHYTNRDFYFIYNISEDINKWHKHLCVEFSTSCQISDEMTFETMPLCNSLNTFINRDVPHKLHVQYRFAETDAKVWVIQLICSACSDNNSKTMLFSADVC